jgi:hypothetical protein
MSRSRPDHPVHQLIAHARELGELSQRAIELSRALEVLAGVDPVAERERLQRGPGGPALAQIQARVDEMLSRADAAACCAVGPTLHPPKPQPRRRHSRSFV